MNHSVILRNSNRVLRPVRVEDAEFIVALRNQDHAKGRINDTSTDVEKQRQWIRDYLERPDEYYWIIEDLNGSPMGTTSLYHYNKELNQIEIGRWVMLKDHTINVIASRIQQFDFAFNDLGVDRVVFDVASYNKPVLRYHRVVLKEREVGIEKGLFVIDGKPVDMIWFEVTKEEWLAMRERQMRISGINN